MSVFWILLNTALSCDSCVIGICSLSDSEDSLSVQGPSLVITVLDLSTILVHIPVVLRVAHVYMCEFVCVRHLSVQRDQGIVAVRLTQVDLLKSAIVTFFSAITPSTVRVIHTSTQTHTHTHITITLGLCSTLVVPFALIDTRKAIQDCSSASY